MQSLVKKYTFSLVFNNVGHIGNLSNCIFVLISMLHEVRDSHYPC